MALTSKSEITDLLGAIGVKLRLDDLGTTANALTRIITYVDNMIFSYTDQQYEQANLLANAWVRSYATMLAANMLTRRRGNKPLFQDERNRIIEELEQISAGIRFIPNCFVRDMPVPSVRSQSVDHSFIGSPLVIDRQRSTGGGYDGEQTRSSLPY